MRRGTSSEVGVVFAYGVSEAGRAPRSWEPAFNEQLVPCTQPELLGLAAEQLLGREQGGLCCITVSTQNEAIAQRSGLGDF